MKFKPLISGLFLLLLFSCGKESEWIVLCGELNENLAIKEISGEYYYENIEYFFINKKSEKCYRNLDTNNFIYAQSLVESKIHHLDSNRINEMLFQLANITKLTSEYINIEFVDDKGKQVLYKINLLEKENDNVFVFVKHNNEYIEYIWTDRYSRSRRTKKFSDIDYKQAASR